MKVFDSYHRKTLRHEWNSRKPSRLLTEEAALVQGYNAIWSPAIEYFSNKIAELPTGSTTERYYFEALLGALEGSKLHPWDDQDSKAVGQKIDGLVAKLGQLKTDATTGDVQDYLNTLIGGFSSFRDQIPAESKESEQEPEPEPEQEPEKQEQETEKQEQPEPDDNSEDELMKSLGF